MAQAPIWGALRRAYNNLTTFTLSFWVNPGRFSGEQSLVGQNDALEVYLNTVGGVTSLMVYMGGPNRADGIDVSTAAADATQYVDTRGDSG